MYVVYHPEVNQPKSIITIRSNCLERKKPFLNYNK